jgi:hypothetical protein
MSGMTALWSLLALSALAQTIQPPVPADVASQHSPAQALNAQAADQPGRVVFLELKNDGGSAVLHAGAVVNAECRVWWARDCADPPTPGAAGTIPKGYYDTVFVTLTLATHDKRRIWFDKKGDPMDLNRRRAVKLVKLLQRQGVGNELTLVVRYMGPPPKDDREYGFGADLVEVVEKRTGQSTRLLDFLARP